MSAEPQRRCSERVPPPAPGPSLAAVYAEHARYVYRCLKGLGVAPRHVDDAVQDVFLVVHDKLAGFDGRHPLRTWLYAIVIRIARRYRARQHPGAFDADWEPSDAHTAEATLASRQALDLAQRALGYLSDEKREVFVLMEVEQMSAPELAVALQIPLNTVYSRLRHARAEFNTHMTRLARMARGGRDG